MAGRGRGQSSTRRSHQPKGQSSSGRGRRRSHTATMEPQPKQDIVRCELKAAAPTQTVQVIPQPVEQVVPQPVGDGDIARSKLDISSWLLPDDQVQTLYHTELLLQSQNPEPSPGGVHVIEQDASQSQSGVQTTGKSLGKVANAIQKSLEDALKMCSTKNTGPTESVVSGGSVLTMGSNVSVSTDVTLRSEGTPPQSSPVLQSPQTPQPTRTVVVNLKKSNIILTAEEQVQNMLKDQVKKDYRQTSKSCGEKDITKCSCT